jgi:hypothetical protein
MSEQVGKSQALLARPSELEPAASCTDLLKQVVWYEYMEGLNSDEGDEVAALDLRAKLIRRIEELTGLTEAQLRSIL